MIIISIQFFIIYVLSQQHSVVTGSDMLHTGQTKQSQRLIKGKHINAYKETKKVIIIIVIIIIIIITIAIPLTQIYNNSNNNNSTQFLLIIIIRLKLPLCLSNNNYILIYLSENSPQRPITNLARVT
jgi:hypothetical protein